MLLLSFEKTTKQFPTTQQIMNLQCIWVWFSFLNFALEPPVPDCLKMIRGPWWDIVSPEVPHDWQLFADKNQWPAAKWPLRAPDKRRESLQEQELKVTEFTYTQSLTHTLALFRCWVVTTKSSGQFQSNCTGATLWGPCPITYAYP